MTKWRSLCIACLLLSYCVNCLALGQGFTCKLQLTKASCWQDYQVTLYIVDKNKPTVVQSFDFPKGLDKHTVEFACNPGQTMELQAQFSPAIWQDDEKKRFISKNLWQIPLRLMPGHDVWMMNVCFSSDFQGVPKPTTALSGECDC